MYTIVDTHCHVYPAAIAAKAAHATDQFYGAVSREDGTADTMLSVEAAAGILHTVICSVATTAHQVRSINRFIAGIAAQQPQRVTGFGTLYPDSPDIGEDLEDALALGLKGIKLHPDIQKFAIDDPRCMEIYRLCQGRVPILFHTGDPRYHYSNPPQLLPVLRAFPELTVIGAHLGGYRNWEEAARQLQPFPNFYVDTSSSLFALAPEQAVDIIRQYGAGRVLFGTDYPMWNPREELDKFLALPLEEEERRLILGQNAVRLLQLEDVTP